MQLFSSTTWKRALAVGLVTAFVVCAELPTNALAANLDKSKNLKRAEKALREGDFEQAEALLRELLSKDTQDEQARLSLSFALLKQRRLQEAYDHAARVLLSNPTSAKAHALLGQAILGSGDFRESVEEFRTALAIKEDEALAVAGLAMVDFYENRLADCVHGLRRAVDQFCGGNSGSRCGVRLHASARRHQCAVSSSARLPMRICSCWRR